MLVELVANAVREALGPMVNGVQVVRQPASSDWDFATPAALSAGRERAEERAEGLAEQLRRRDVFEAVGVTGAGYVNVRFRSAVFAAMLRGIRPDTSPTRAPATATSVAAGEVRYAHALLAMIQRNAAAVGLTADLDALDLGVLAQRPERTLLTALGEYPAVLDRATASTPAPAPVLALLTEIAGLVPMFVEDRLAVPRGDHEPDHTHRTRLALVGASRIVLANGLAALGLPAPDRI